MGIKKPGSYTVSEHAKERFLERFGIDSDESLDTIRTYLTSSAFIQNTKSDCEMWVNIKRGIVFVISPSKKSIVTTYPISDETVPDIHDDLASFMYQSVTQYKNKMLRKFGADTSVLYKELTELTDKLSRTSQPKAMAANMAQIKQLRRELNRRIDYHQELTASANIELHRLQNNKKEVSAH